MISTVDVARADIRTPASTSVPSLVLGCFPSKDQGNAALSEFAGLLQLFLQSSTLRGRFDHYFLLMRWVAQSDDSIPLPVQPKPQTADDKTPLPAQDRRWRRSHVLRLVIVNSPELRAKCAEVLGAMVAETSCVSFFGEAGLPHERGFFAEAVTRVAGYFIPTPRNDTDLKQQVCRLYRNTGEARQFSHLPLEMFHEIVEAFLLPDHREIWQPGAKALREAFVLLAARVQGLGLSHELRVRSSSKNVSESPFFKLPRCADRLLEVLESKQDASAADRTWRDTLAECKRELRLITRDLRLTGVSVSMVFNIETIETCLQRMETISNILTMPDGMARSIFLHGLISRCIVATLEDKSVSRLLANNLHLLSKKIVERTGKIGGHYIARNLKEYQCMWLAAAGGGILTVATATLKMKIVSWQLAPLPEGLFAGLNYAVSFIVMLVFGLALATKQPAMTGSALGGILREHSGKDRLDRIADAFMLICRTQIAAAIGNIVLVFIGCIALGRVWQAAYREPVLSAHEAEHIFTSLNPISSGTAFFAGVTGVLLWLSSLAGGWIDNWSVCNKLPQAIADHKLGERIGVARMRSLARFWENNVGSWGNSIALGFMLGLTPEFGRFTGIPMDVRHVTLSTGTLALSVASVGSEWSSNGWLFYAAAGIAVTFVLNLSVSFMLAFLTAVRAYELSFRELMQLAALTGNRMIGRPWEFILPIGWPKQDDALNELH